MKENERVGAEGKKEEDVMHPQVKEIKASLPQGEEERNTPFFPLFFRCCEERISVEVALLGHVTVWEQ